MSVISLELYHHQEKICKRLERVDSKIHHHEKRIVDLISERGKLLELSNLIDQSLSGNDYDFSIFVELERVQIKN